MFVTMSVQKRKNCDFSLMVNSRYHLIFFFSLFMRHKNHCFFVEEFLLLTLGSVLCRFFPEKATSLALGVLHELVKVTVIVLMQIYFTLQYTQPIIL